MKRTLALILIVQIVGISPAFAQTDPPREQVIDIDAMLLEADRKNPHLYLHTGDMKPKFERLMKLKKSMLPKLRETANSRVLN